jgi:hypothetical protein
MKRYPSIPKKGIPDLSAYAFDKLDGSNIRAEWSKKKGFYKFGSRKEMIDSTHSFLGECPEMIVDKYEKDVTDILKKNRIERAVLFFEYWSENSFAGYHEDEPHEITLFDIDVYKKGLLPPKEYLQLFGDLDIAKLLHQGNINSSFIESVMDGTLEGMTYEGVVCKAPNPKRKILRPLMFKIKNKAWLDRLKERCGDDEKLFEKLA